MSESSQSLVKVYQNNNNDIVLVYGNSEECDIQHLEISRLVINKDDLMAISEALAAAVSIEDGDENE